MTRLGSHLGSDNCLDVGNNSVQIDMGYMSKVSLGRYLKVCLVICVVRIIVWRQNYDFYFLLSSIGGSRYS
jgi:hypothetical protein